MIMLTDHQIDIVSMAIERFNLKHDPLKEELLDHFCCLVEENLDRGLTFEEALKKCMASFNEQDLSAIEKEILFTKKNKIMKNILVVTSMLLLFSSTFLLAQVKNTPNLSPVSKEHRISSGFGEQIHPMTKKPRHHDGLDIAAPEGTPVVAPADGTVIHANKNQKHFGNNILIQHDDSYQTFYSHLSEMLVTPGQKISKGEMIGKVGNTGLSSGPHLHYEVIHNGEKVDPLVYLKEHSNDKDTNKN